MFGMMLHPAVVAVAESMSQEERQRLVTNSLLDTRDQGLEPSERAKELAEEWVHGKISFQAMANGIMEEAWKEERERGSNG